MEMPKTPEKKESDNVKMDLHLDKSQLLDGASIQTIEYLHSQEKAILDFEDADKVVDKTQNLRIVKDELHLEVSEENLVELKLIGTDLRKSKLDVDNSKMAGRSDEKAEDAKQIKPEEGNNESIGALRNLARLYPNWWWHRPIRTPLLEGLLTESPYSIHLRFSQAVFDQWGKTSTIMLKIRPKFRERLRGWISECHDLPALLF